MAVSKRGLNWQRVIEPALAEDDDKRWQVIWEPENGTVCEEIKRIGRATGVCWNAASGTDTHTHTHNDQNWANTRHRQPDTKQRGKADIADNFNSPLYQTEQRLGWPDGGFAPSRPGVCPNAAGSSHQRPTVTRLPPTLHDLSY